MSDYHIQEMAADMKTVNTVFHIPIPIGDNTVGVAWRDALVAHKGGADAITSGLLDISAADMAALKAGELLERVSTVRFSSLFLTDAERLAEIRAAYTVAQTDTFAELQAKLQYYGYVGDI